MTTNKYPLPLLLFDSECTLCTRFKDALLRIPGAETITIASIHDQEIYQHYSSINYENCQQELHFIDHQGTVFSGSEAITNLSQQFPTINKFAWLIESGMGKKSIDYFYKMADSYRKSLLNRCPTCK